MTCPIPQDLHLLDTRQHLTKIQPACQGAVARVQCGQRMAEDGTSMKPACVSPFGCRHRSLNVRAAWRKTHPPEDFCQSHQGYRQFPCCCASATAEDCNRCSGRGKLPIIALAFRSVQSLCEPLCSCTDLVRGCWKSEPYTHCIDMD